MTCGETMTIKYLCVPEHVPTVCTCRPLPPSAEWKSVQLVDPTGVTKGHHMLRKLIAATPEWVVVKSGVIDLPAETTERVRRIIQSRRIVKCRKVDLLGLMYIFGYTSNVIVHNQTIIKPIHTSGDIIATMQQRSEHNQSTYVIENILVYFKPIFTERCEEKLKEFTGTIRSGDIIQLFNNFMQRSIFVFNLSFKIVGNLSSIRASADFNSCLDIVRRNLDLVKELRDFLQGVYEYVSGNTELPERGTLLVLKEMQRYLCFLKWLYNFRSSHLNTDSVDIVDQVSRSEHVIMNTLLSLLQLWKNVSIEIISFWTK